MKERKKELRRTLLQGRKGTETAHPASLWTREAYERCGLDRFTALFSYLSFPTEPDTQCLHELALERGLTLGVPKVHGGVMGFYRLESAEGPFETGPYGIREPFAGASPLWLPAGFDGKGASQIAEVGTMRESGFPLFPLLVAVPGLAFTRDGRRLGRGGGYYDRFIAELLAANGHRRDRITLMGICGEDRLIADIPTESHDARLDCLLTEKDYIICKEHSED